VDAVNVLVEEAHVAFKTIARLDTFVNKEQWNMTRIKEEYHAKFVMIM
jgi:hypothetical protein